MGIGVDAERPEAFAQPRVVEPPQRVAEVDRLEVWNPGRLPGTLTFKDLRRDHPSVPANPLLAESLYLVRYVEKHRAELRDRYLR